MEEIFSRVDLSFSMIGIQSYSGVFLLILLNVYVSIDSWHIVPLTVAAYIILKNTVLKSFFGIVESFYPL